MSTVLQQHLNRLTNGYDNDSTRGDTNGTRSGTPSTAIYHHHRATSPTRLSMQPTYSYLQDSSSLKRPVDVYDRKISAPAQMSHYHIPVDSDGSRIPSRSRSTYMQQLYGRRARSFSRTGMRVMVDELQTTPRARSPHMNNEEPINLSHYPDGRKPDEADSKKAAIERDDFPAPPFVYGDNKRRRRWSEPEKNQDDGHSDGHETPVEESDDENEEEVVDEKLDRNEAELRKISTGMCQVFLTEIAVERERRRSAKSRLIDPRSSARTPSANREPHYRLRYDSPVNASPSRIADHAHPWDDDTNEGTISRRSFTPYLPGNPGALIGRAVSPVQSKTGFGYSNRFSPNEINKTCSTDFSCKSDFSETGQEKQDNYSTGLITPDFNARPHSAGGTGKSTPKLDESLAEISDTHNNSLSSIALVAPNVYPMHLLVTTNYRLPADVDRNNLEKHLTDSKFELAFKMSRESFYQLPYWKRCDLKRKNNLF